MDDVVASITIENTALKCKHFVSPIFSEFKSFSIRYLELYIHDAIL